MSDEPSARAHIERYALTPRHRVVALALLDSTVYDPRSGESWLGIANNVVKALDEMAAPRSSSEAGP